MGGAGAVLGVDVGGTGIKARLTDAEGLVLDETRVPTPRDDPDAGRLATVVAELAVRASQRAPLGAIGLVTPGVVDETRGTVVLSVNLGWRDVPVRGVVRAELLRRGIDVPLAFGHDVRAGALAEVRAGDPELARGSVSFVPVGTGLASALVVDGVVVPGGGWAGEIGQVRIQSGAHAGSRVEEIASAGGVARRAGAPSAHAVMLRVRDGDPAATAVWDDCVGVLADALAWTTAVAGCHTIIVGGGLAESGPLLLDPLRAAVTARLQGVRVPVIAPARHGDAAGAIGAGLLARALLDTGVLL
ncbi:ROK family protein [Curtobacterium aurantiacum]|uniref:ROK family protein n=1 Tax=Curtobacterium aurantiacum TaxID=3236919 RepID=UPI001BDDE905|nr:ROK family protein [Curtobacterium flaccumfaciens]MBT1675530.1 ROK family protein [Curtobacterium flaccumfaciens pv. flaccumfaciens]MBT1680300.1 ROK family protein [Curtobacterium flaccumfaciens pv. flaccumfaciens]